MIRGTSGPPARRLLCEQQLRRSIENLDADLVRRYQRKQGLLDCVYHLATKKGSSTYREELGTKEEYKAKLSTRSFSERGFRDDCATEKALTRILSKEN
jgi:hypothetical protein